MRNIYLFILIGSLLGISDWAVGQTTNDSSLYKPVLPVYRDIVGDTTVISKNKLPQQKEFVEGTYLYPPKPRDKWEVGAHIGGFTIGGDVKTVGGMGFGVAVRKSFGYALSTQLHYFHGTTYGLNFQPHSGLLNNKVLNGFSGQNLNYADNEGLFFYNYRNVTDELTANLILTINNIGFHKRALDRKLNFYVGVGAGGMVYASWYNALDANGNRYDFRPISNTQNIKDKKEIRSELRALLDDSYETPVEGQPEDPSFLNRSFKPVFNGMFGVGYHVTKNVSLSLTTRFTASKDDLIDGMRWQEHPYIDPALSGDFDSYQYTALGVGYALGGNKRVEQLYWQNPLEFTYDALNTLIKKNVDDLMDTDDDGVLDKLDRESGSPKGAVVDTHGVTQDQDGDGIPDFLDKERLTPPGAKTDSNGVMKDKIVYMSDLPKLNVGGANYCNTTTFPSVHFELDKYFIQPEFYSHLHIIAMAMISCPEKKMVAVGNADVRESNAYNDILSWERVNKVVDYLVTTYGVDRNRFVINFKGESNPKIPGLPDNSWSPVYESRQYVNRRVDFRWAKDGETGSSNPPKPKGPKAGKEY